MTLCYAFLPHALAISNIFELFNFKNSTKKKLGRNSNSICKVAGMLGLIKSINILPPA